MPRRFQRISLSVLCTGVAAFNRLALQRNIHAGFQPASPLSRMDIAQWACHELDQRIQTPATAVMLFS
jgi:hypothetical protein